MTNNWRIKITRLDDRIDWFDLGSDELTARELFRDLRRNQERGKNDPTVVEEFLSIGHTVYQRRTIVDLELVAPSRTNS